MALVMLTVGLTILLIVRSFVHVPQIETQHRVELLRANELVMAIRERREIGEIESLIKDRPSVLHDAAREGNILNMAVAYGRGDVVRLLLEEGLDVNAGAMQERDQLRGLSPIVIAVGDGDQELVQILIEAGADLNCPRAGFWNVTRGYCAT